MTNSISFGSACFCPSLQVQKLKIFDKKTSVHFAEYSASNVPYNLALTHKNLKFFIFSDSLWSLQALNSAKTSVKTNQFILDIEEKYLASESTSAEAPIELFWMPSHIGIPGNKEVDCLAEQASQSPCLQNTQVHYSDLREESKRAAFLRTKEKTQTQGLLHDTQSLFRINVVDSPLCTCNLYEENLNHVPWQCSLYNPERNKQVRNSWM